MSEENEDGEIRRRERREWRNGEVKMKCLIGCVVIGWHLLPTDRPPPAPATAQN